MDYRSIGNGVAPRPSRSDAETSLEEQFEQLKAICTSTEIKSLEDSAMKATSREKRAKAAQKLDTLIVTFLNGVDYVLDALSGVGRAHPVAEAAVSAFQMVVKLDIIRRENNRKVQMVLLHMQCMLGPIFQLGDLDSAHMSDSAKITHEESLKEIITAITGAINKCRSDLTHFLGRKFIYTLVLSKAYEKMLTGHMEIFSRYRSDLQYVMTTYMAVGISTVNASVARLDWKLDDIISMFRTTRENEALQFIDLHGGPGKCVNDLDVLSTLLTKASESFTTGKGSVLNRSELEEMQASLKEALKTNLDAVLKKHYSLFEKIIQVNNNNLTSYLEDHVTSKVDKLVEIMEGISKAKFKFEDPEIQDIWTRMDIKLSSVKAKLFVLTFRDHVRTTGSPVQSSALLPQSEEEPSVLLSESPSLEKLPDDEWAFAYMDVAYVQPIVDAMDEDISGFISVKEVNTFAHSRDRPKDMKFLEWIAYWAAGWHMNLVRYQSDIHSLLLQMDEAASSVHVANRFCVNEFLNRRVMRRIEALCQSLKPLPNPSRRDANLQAVANDVASWQLDRLLSNLKTLSFVIDSSLIATTISGSTRIEMCIFPILYLLLQRHLKIIRLAETMVLDQGEFWAHSHSLMSIFSAFDERRETLEAKFSQLHKDVDSQFRNFSYGMFYAAYKQDEFNITLNVLPTPRSQWCRYFNREELSPQPKGTPDISILSQPVGNAFDFSALDLRTIPPGHVAHPIEGNWLGWDQGDPYICVIHPIVDNKLIGKGQRCFGTIDMLGTVGPVSDSEDRKIQITFELTSSGWGRRLYKGVYDPFRDLITGTYEWMDVAEEGSEDDSEDDNEDNDADLDDEEDQVFRLTRTPPHLCRFRVYLDGPAPAILNWNFWTQARKRWVFAIEAIKYEKRSPRKAIAEGLAERDLWLYYAVRYDFSDPEIEPDTWDMFTPLSDNDWDVYNDLTSKVRPDTARMWEEMAHFLTRRLTYLWGRWTCCVCKKYITFCRYYCIECTTMRDNEHMHTIDLCENCFENNNTNEFSGSWFVHLSTHSLLRLRTWVHTYELNRLTVESRLISGRCKEMFRNLETQKKANTRTGKTAKGKASRKIPVVENSESPIELVPEPINCACCKKQLSLPCWVCIECSPLALICINCDYKFNNSSYKTLPNHSALKHHILFIHDSTVVNKATDDKASEAERHFDGLNTSVKEINLQLQALKFVVESALVLQEDDASCVDPEGEPSTALEEKQKGEESKQVENDEHAIAPEPTKMKTITVEIPVNQLDVPTGVRRSEANLPERLATLETRVDSILNHLARDEHKIDALETKIDRQFEMLAALIRKDFTNESTTRTTSSFYGRHNV